VAEPIQIGEGRGSNRRVLVLAGVAAAILLGVVVLPGLLFSDSSSPSTEDAFGSVEPSATVTTVAPTGPEPPETFEVFSSTNPFHPLVETEAVVDDTSGEAVDDQDIPEPFPTFEDDPTFGEEFVVPDPDAPVAEEPDDTTSTTTGPPARQPDRVSLLEVFTDAGGQVVASVRVNDITYQVAEGDDFATSYRVIDLDISTRCGQLLFGDDRFGLCEGDEVLK
jgi:hypothetical protein